MTYGKAAVAAVVAVACADFFGGVVACASVPGYRLIGSFEAPEGAFGILPDGRLLSVGGEGNREVFVQESVNAGSFSRVGEIATAGEISSFGASFVAVSPDGGTVAVGDGNFAADASVYTFAVDDVLDDGVAATERTVTPNLAGEFADDATLFVAGSDVADGAGVYRVGVGGGASERVIGDIGGASGGVAVRDGVLFTANGFDFVEGGSEVGEVRAVGLDALGGEAVSFEAEMTPVAGALTGASLDFDVFGNLLIGDAPLSGEPMAGVVDGEAVLDALGGGVFERGLDLALDPLPDSGVDAFGLSAVFNDATGELLVSGGGVVFRYEVPSPGVVVVLGVAGVGVIGGRRRG